MILKTATKLNLLFNNKIALDCTQKSPPKLNIPKGSELILSLDPSSSQTGFVLGDCLGNVYLIGDYINYQKVLDKSEYAAYLKAYLRLLTSYYPIKYFVYEVPFTPGIQDIATKVLTYMESTFKTYSDIVCGLEKENCYPILPSVWRKTYFDKKEYTGMKKNRETLKMIAQKEAVLRFPEYASYLNQEKIPDSTDALGVFFGFIMENWYDYSQNILNVSKTNSRYSRNHLFTGKVTLSSPEYISKEICGGTKVFAYNKRYSLEDTQAIVTSLTEDTCLVIPFDTISRNLLIFDSEVPIGASQQPILICRRTNKIKTN